MPEPAQQFYLLVEDLAGATTRSEGSSPAAPMPAGFRPLALPAGIVYLSVPPDAPPSLIVETTAADDETLLLESVFGPQPPQLVLLAPGRHRPRVNGQVVPRLALLQVKDQVQLNADRILHVTLFNRPQIAVPPPHLVGKQCPFCRTELGADTTVYICSTCGTPMHCEGEEKGPNRLECACLASECLACAAAVVMQQGFAYVPEPSDG